MKKIFISLFIVGLLTSWAFAADMPATTETKGALKTEPAATEAKVVAPAKETKHATKKHKKTVKTTKEKKEDAGIKVQK